MPANSVVCNVIGQRVSFVGGLECEFSSPCYRPGQWTQIMKYAYKAISWHKHFVPGVIRKSIRNVWRWGPRWRSRLGDSGHWIILVSFEIIYWTRPGAHFTAVDSPLPWCSHCWALIITGSWLHLLFRPEGRQLCEDICPRSIGNISLLELAMVCCIFQHETRSTGTGCWPIWI